MAYIGKLPNTTGKDAGPSLKLDDISSGFNGNTKVFDLTVAGTSVDPHVNNTQIYLSGVHQLPGTAYTLSGSQIVFTAAPSSSLSFHGAMIGDATLFTPNQDTIEPAAFTDNARTALSGSFSQTHLSSKISGIVSASVLSSPAQGTLRLATNGVNTDVDSGLQAADSPTFAAGTITGDLSVGGTLTAQEIHTEFTSASIMFSSGSTKFGDTIDDTHEVTGSMTMSGSVTVNDGNLLVTDKVGFGTNNPSNVLHLEFNDDSDVFTAARITDNSVSGILINNLDTGNGHGGMIKFANKNGDNHTAIAHSQDGNTDASLLFYSMDGGTLAEVMRVDHTHRVGIGDGAPGSPLDVKSSEAANTANFNSTNGATNITFESDGSLIGQMEFL